MQYATIDFQLDELTSFKQTQTVQWGLNVCQAFARHDILIGHLRLETHVSAQFTWNFNFIRKFDYLMICR